MQEQLRALDAIALMLINCGKWWARQGLNLRPHPCEGDGTSCFQVFQVCVTLPKSAEIRRLPRL